jgi:hypothetical protein
MRLVALTVVLALAGCSESGSADPVVVDDTSPADSASDGDAFVADSANVVEDGAGDSGTADSATSDATAVDSADTAIDTADTALDTRDTAIDTADTALDTRDTSFDTRDSADVASDADADTIVTDTGDAGGVLPGAACVGTLTDDALVTLYAGKPMSGTPTFILGGSSTARKLGSYTTALYSRSCASTTGCTAWAAAAQPAYETFHSINSGILAGSVYLWSPSSGSHRIAIVSNTIGSDCKGWTEGIGTMVRSGSSASVTLATKVEDNCTAGADPVFYFQEIDLYDPTGIVTDHCMKLTYSKQRNRVDVGPGAYTYDEYMVVYDASY